MHISSTINSPDLNPLEELFSYVKYYFKCHEDILQAVTDPKPIIKAAFQSVTKQDCLGWISHSAYMKKPQFMFLCLFNLVLNIKMIKIMNE